jgi:hypothetical protein
MTNRDEVLAEKNKRLTVRVRQKNKQEQKLLDYKLECIDYDKQKKSGILDKYIKNMQVEVYGAPLDDDSATPLTRPTSGGFTIDSRPYSGYSLREGSIMDDIPSRPDTHMSAIDMESELRAALGRPETVFGCRFGVFDGSCKHFPCCVPETYNSFREYDTGKNISPRSRLLEGRVRSSTPVLRTEATSIKSTISSRERALKTMIKDMKQRNEKVRPTDRNVKYGEPLSLRKLYKPARPSFAQD